MPARNMKNTHTRSTAGLLKYAILASCVEKPPIATVENAWHRASNQPMPAMR